MRSDIVFGESFAEALGVIYDRSVLQSEPVGKGFLVGDKLLLCAASASIPYANNPGILKVNFPATKRNFYVGEVIIHPKYSTKDRFRLLEQGLLSDAPQVTTSDFNCCLMRLSSKMSAIYENDLTEVRESLRAPMQVEHHDLNGSLSDLDFSLLVQTLTNARKEGILYLFNQGLVPIAQIFCGGGRIISGRFGTLSGSTALYQIIEKRAGVSFEFHPCSPGMYWPRERIDSSTDMILLEGARRLDELRKLKENFHVDEEDFFVRKSDHCDVSMIAEAVRETALKVWNALDASTKLGDLWKITGLDDFSVYNAVCVFLASDQIFVSKSQRQNSSPGSNPSRETMPLPLSLAGSRFKADTVIDCLLIDSLSGDLCSKSGLIVLDSSGDARHNIELSPDALGAPLVSNGAVLGMHLGFDSEGGSSQRVFKFLVAGIIQNFLNENVSGSTSSNQGSSHRPMIKMLKRSPQKTDWKMTLIWFAVGFAIVLGLKLGASLLMPN